MGKSQGLSPAACPGGCYHSDEEHRAFDAGIAAGEAGKSAEDCPYGGGNYEDNLQEVWLIGHSVGELNRNA